MALFGFGGLPWCANIACGPHIRPQVRESRTFAIGKCGARVLRNPKRKLMRPERSELNVDVDVEVELMSGGFRNLEGAASNAGALKQGSGNRRHELSLGKPRRVEPASQ